jgi:BirA family biotin operon repressor/biotin-[acetyl-CoA-carboxylase] ligase
LLSAVGKQNPDVVITERTNEVAVLHDPCSSGRESAPSGFVEESEPTHVGCYDFKGESRSIERDIVATGSTADVWRLHEHAEVTSTNLIAAKLPAWHAVRADTQTAGRGRFQRSWVSDAGGLWLSAVLPVETNSPAWRILPLAMGVAVCDVLRDLGVTELRLRWPNDVLVRDRKLAGLLIDQFQAGLAVVGIGINVGNRPEICDPALEGLAVRLADLISPVPSVSDLAQFVLAALRDIWSQVLDMGSGSVLPRINALWDLPRRVQLDLDGTMVEGEFAGVDAGGRLRLRLSNNVNQFFEPQEVKLLRDIP